MNPLRQRALAILREGRCRVILAHCDDMNRVVHCVAVVTSSRGPQTRYAVDLTEAGGWSCTCHHGTGEITCAHVAAVRLVVGHADRELLGVAS